MATKSIYVKPDDLPSWLNLEAYIKNNNSDKRKKQLALGSMLTSFIKNWEATLPKQENIALDKPSEVVNPAKVEAGIENMKEGL